MSQEPSEPGPTDGGAQETLEPVQISQNEGASMAPESAQVQPQETQREQISINIVKRISNLPSAFQLLIGGYVMKLSLIGSVANCANYVSRSGNTWNGCFVWTNGELKETRGLYRIKEGRVISLSNNSKLFVDLNAFKTWLKETLEGLYGMELIPGRMLVVYDNYSFTAYSNFDKVPTIEIYPWTYQGHLEIFRVVEPEVYVDMKEADTLEIYNHKVTFSKKVYASEVSTHGTGKAYLIYTNDMVHLHAESPDHPAEGWDIGPGWYLIAHRRPRPRARVD